MPLPPPGDVPASVGGARPAPWCCRRRRVEGSFRLPGSRGRQQEHRQQEGGAAIARRLPAACAVVRRLRAADSPEARAAEETLVRPGGRSRKHRKAATAAALPAGSMRLPAVTDLLERGDVDLAQLQQLARTALPFADTS